MIETFLDPKESLEMKLKSWSHSRLTTFEGCKLRAKLSYIDRIPEPERPLPAGKTEHANDRGTRLHDAAEKYIRGGVELQPELAKHFEPEYVKARELFLAGQATMEGDWAFTKDWEPTAWMSSDAWLRMKLDLCIHLSDREAVSIDYKSGKRFGNELKHAEQMQIYTIGTFRKYPKLQKVTTELWYLDQNELATMTYTREQGLRYIKNYERRGSLLTDCEEFPANPNQFTCRWCPYKPQALGGTGHCQVGV
jgi:RecB family exonuclease